MIDRERSVLGGILDGLEDWVGREGVVVLLLFAPIFAMQISDATWGPVFALWGVGLLFILIAREGESEDVDNKALRDAREAYVRGDMTLSNFEQEVKLALDGEASRIRNAIEHIDGIGPETSSSIALEFDTLEDLRRAERDDLLEVYGVGPATAEKIESEVRR